MHLTKTETSAGSGRAALEVSSGLVSALSFQVATANLAWASVAIHQVQVSVGGVAFLRGGTLLPGLGEQEHGLWWNSSGGRC